MPADRQAFQGAAGRAFEPPHPRYRSDKREMRFNADPYRTLDKPSADTRCSDCGLVYRDGRWRRLRPKETRPPADGPETVCPACRRIRDDYPAGQITLRGRFLDRNRQELLNLVRHQEQSENSEHPLHRIMSVTELPGEIRITTTDTHLPRRIARALKRSHGGELHLDRDGAAHFLHVLWRRDD